VEKTISKKKYILKKINKNLTSNNLVKEIYEVLINMYLMLLSKITINKASKIESIEVK
jgi:hypothetical protein